MTRVRWSVFDGVFGEGLWLRPKQVVPPYFRPTPDSIVIAIPDADQTPEMLAGLEPGIPPQSQFGRALAESGFRVLIPVLVNRADTFSGNTEINRFTNQPHREWIYRQAYEMGRHLIGYEVQKVLAAVDWFATNQPAGAPLKLCIAGYGEGGLLALYTAALDTRINTSLVSGYFGSREHLWKEPIYRNVWGLLRTFGDAEIASMIAPRNLIVEYSAPPQIDGPPVARDGRRGAAPGKISPPSLEEVTSELARARKLTAELQVKWSPFVYLGSTNQVLDFGKSISLSALAKVAGAEIQIKTPSAEEFREPSRVNAKAIEERQHRQVNELVQFTQRLLEHSERVRDQVVWNKFRSGATNEWTEVCRTNRETLWTEVIGQLPRAYLPVNTRTRQTYDTEKWTGYEVVLDVLPDVFAWGALLVPKGIKPGERRPVVVCQHGLEGLPDDVVNPDPKIANYHYYKSFGAKLADLGFVVYAPHNPYRGEDRFRVLQRKANPLKLSLFSFILAQHDVTTTWLAELPFVDPKRIGFYGLSYGGKTAMRVPALLDRYALSICSADFNDWIRKNVTLDSPYSYMFIGEYELPEFNLGETFNYAEMASLIAPRPFMVERGHLDGVAPDEWVAYEYAKVRRHYAFLGIPDRTEIEFFNGPHTINGVGTFKFLEKYLDWPKAPSRD